MSIKRISNRDLRDMAARLLADGWRLEERTSHPMFFAPWGKDIVTCANSPSNRRGIQNFRADIRRAYRLHGKVPPV